MSIWEWFIKKRTTDTLGDVVGQGSMQRIYDASRYAIIDIEVGLTDHKIHDIGALRHDGAIYHKASKDELEEFLHDVYLDYFKQVKPEVLGGRDSLSFRDVALYSVKSLRPVVRLSQRMQSTLVEWRQKGL